MKQRYTIGNYVKISQLDEQGTPTIFLAEAEMPLKVTLGKELLVRPCLRNAEWINLGIVSEVRNYKKRSHIEVCTNNGWYAIDVSVGLESIMTDSMNYWAMMLEAQLGQILNRSVHFGLHGLRYGLHKSNKNRGCRNKKGNYDNRNCLIYW